MWSVVSTGVWSVVFGSYWFVCGLCQVLVCENGEWKMMTVDESKPRVGLCVVSGSYWCVCVVCGSYWCVCVWSVVSGRYWSVWSVVDTGVWSGSVVGTGVWSVVGVGV